MVDYKHLLYSEGIILENAELVERVEPGILSRHARFASENIGAVQALLKKEDVRRREHWVIPDIYPSDDYAFACFVVVTSAVNFAYWVSEDPTGLTRFSVNRPSRRGQWAGAFALNRCFARVFGERVITADLLAPHFSTVEKTRKFFEGNPPIPFLGWRYRNLQEVIAVLKEKFSGDPLNVYEEAGWSVVRLVNVLTKEFPYAFGHDIGTIRAGVGLRKTFNFPFYKRAKLIPLMYQGRALRPGSSLRPLEGIDSIVAVQDYRAPQFLRAHGLLRVSEDLAGRIDRLEILLSGSEEEIALRVATTQANFALKLALGLDILALDYMEWAGARGLTIPHHRTPTSAY